MPTSEPSLQAEGLRPPAPAGRAEEEEEVEEEERRKADAYRRRLSLVRVKKPLDTHTLSQTLPFFLPPAESGRVSAKAVAGAR